jgi:hypothetical protein
MKELTPRARAILNAGRDLHEPADLEKARVRRALLAKVTADGVPVETARPVVESGGLTGGAAGF